MLLLHHRGQDHPGIVFRSKTVYLEQWKLLLPLSSHLCMNADPKDYRPSFWARQRDKLDKAQHPSPLESADGPSAFANPQTKCKSGVVMRRHVQGYAAVGKSQTWVHPHNQPSYPCLGPPNILTRSRRTALIAYHSMARWHSRRQYPRGCSDVWGESALPRDKNRYLGGTDGS